MFDDELLCYAEVFAIFADYLEKDPSVEYIYSQKFGPVLLLDLSTEYERVVYAWVPDDLEDFARKLFALEMSFLYFEVYDMPEEPRNASFSDIEFMREKMRPRLRQLPERFNWDVDIFFT